MANTDVVPAELEAAGARFPGFGSEYKASGTVFVRRLVREAGPDVEAAFKARLPPSDVALCDAATASQWVPIFSMTRICVAAAHALHPTLPEDEALRIIGRGMARDHLSGIYKMMVKLVSPHTLMDASGKVWSMYSRAGKALYVKAPGGTGGDFFVSEYPQMPERFRECTAGYMEGALMLTGVKEPRVTRFNDPARWQWKMRW